jgi:hypothetical protein
LFTFGTDRQFLGGKLERKDFSRDVRGGLCPQVVHGGRVETLLELHRRKVQDSSWSRFRRRVVSLQEHTNGSLRDRLLDLVSSPQSPSSHNICPCSILLGAIAALVVVNTLCDVCLSGSRGNPKICTMFSLYTNGKKLVSTSCTNDTLRCLHGVKVLSMMWIILSQVTVTKLSSININAIDEWKNRLENSVFFAGHYALDTFFSLSGILIVYTHLKYSQEGKPISLGFYTRRFLRY